MDPVPARVAELLNTLRQPIRLSLLVALEERGEASATQLSDQLGASFDNVNYALKSLAEEGVVEFVRYEPAGASVRRIYRVRVQGWARLVGLLDDFAGEAKKK